MNKKLFSALSMVSCLAITFCGSAFAKAATKETDTYSLDIASQMAHSNLYFNDQMNLATLDFTIGLAIPTYVREDNILVELDNSRYYPVFADGNLI